MLKKVLALFTTLALVLSMGAVTAFAADVSGDGETTWVEEDIDGMLLPTSQNWTFVLDPQGLVGAYRDRLNNGLDFDAGVTKAQLSAYAGRILANDYSPVLVNESSYPVLLGVDIQIVGDDDDFIIVDDQADVETSPTDTDKNILLNVNLAKDSVATAGVTFATAGVTVDEPLDAETKTLEFVLEAPEYVFTSANGEDFDYILPAGTAGFGTQLQLGGYINQNADWSDYIGDTPSKTISVEATFSVDKATPEEIAKLTTIDGQPNPYSGAAYGYIGLKDTTPPDTVINATAISGVTAPVAGEAPVLSVTAGTGYTGTVEWDPPVAGGGTFAANTDYTATITLSAEPGYTLTGVTQNQFTVADATATNPANSGVITAVFPKTGTLKSASATVTSATGVVKITPTGFSFPSGTRADYTITANAGSGTNDNSNVGTATTSLSGGDLTVTMPSGWFSGGTNQGFTKLTVSWSGGSVVITKASGSTNTLTAVTVS